MINKNRHPIIKWIKKTMVVFISCLGVVTLIAGLCIFSENLYPLTMDRIEITNGTKTIVFENMIHVGSPHFYNEIREDVRIEKQNGATYMYEGIHNDNIAEATELASKLTQSTSQKHDMNIFYNFLAKISGLQMQPQKTFMGFPGHEDINADMNASQLLRLMNTRAERSLPKIESNLASESKIDNLDEIERNYDNLSSFDKFLINRLSRNLMSLIVRYNTYFYDNVPYKEEVEDSRNKYLAETALAGPDRIVITYGSAHFNGFLHELIQHDKNWHIVSVIHRPVFME